ncbi:MAG: hypothetical protein NUV67_06355 [archaeon]|nr:hypothetical protein [archaeon]
MNNHDIMRDLLKEKESIEKIGKKAQLGDIEQLLEEAENPKVLALLMYKLIQEKERSNKLLETISEKYDNIMFSLKTAQQGSQMQGAMAEIGEKQEAYEIFPEQDQLIMKTIGEQGSCTANDIKTMLNYRGLNAACQRLNKLFKEGHLKKVKSGRKVLYLAKS